MEPPGGDTQTGTYDDVELAPNAAYTDVPFDSFVRLEHEDDVVLFRRLHLRPNLNDNVGNRRRLAGTRVR